MAKYNTRSTNKRIQRNVITPKETVQPNTAGPEDEISPSVETNKKRKSSKSVDSEREIKRSKKASNTHDSYCWKCHKAEVEVECSTCPRAFHSTCLKGNKINEDERCYVCQQESIAKPTSNSDEEIDLSKLLLHIVKIACPLDETEYKPLVHWPDRGDNEKLICKKDISLILDRCSSMGIPYESHVELVEDVKWMYHNCIIIYGDKSSIVKSAKKVLDNVIVELNDAINCPECYWKKISSNESLAFLHICETPHPLVWAKVKGYSYWPAKCFRVSKDNKAHVKFFHTHQISKVPLTNVLAMSEKCPSNATKEQFSVTSELKAYLDIFKEECKTEYPHKAPEDPKTPKHRKAPKDRKDKEYSYNFEEEQRILKDILDNRQRKRLLSGDTFRSPHENEQERIFTLIDLDDESGVEEQAVMPPPNAEGENLLNVSSTTNSSMDESLIDEANPRTVESVQEAIASQRSLSSNLSNSDDHPWLPQPPIIAISNVMSGTDIPMDSSNELLGMPASEPSPFQSASVFTQSSISASNSMQLSLRNYSRLSDACRFAAPPAYQHDDDDIEIIEEIPSNDANIVTDDANMNKRDVECILQTILKYDPKALTSLKQVKLLVQQLFIQIWGNGAKLKKPEDIIQYQDNKIKGLKLQLEEMRSKMSVIKKDYEEMQLKIKKDYEERIQNADEIVRSLKTELDSQREKLKVEVAKNEKLNEEWKVMLEEEVAKSEKLPNEKWKEMLKVELAKNDKRWKEIVDENEKKYNEKLKEMLEEEVAKSEKLLNEKWKEMLKVEMAKNDKRWKEILDENEKKCNERMKEAREFKYCENNDCTNLALIPCCLAICHSTKSFCSESCKEKMSKSHENSCKAGQVECYKTDCKNSVKLCGHSKIYSSSYCSENCKDKDYFRGSCVPKQPEGECPTRVQATNVQESISIQTIHVQKRTTMSRVTSGAVATTSSTPQQNVKKLEKKMARNIFSNQGQPDIF